jgi:hypothetical protein
MIILNTENTIITIINISINIVIFNNFKNSLFSATFKKAVIIRRASTTSLLCKVVDTFLEHINSLQKT